jgi:hypothetical protein
VAETALPERSARRPAAVKVMVMVFARAFALPDASVTPPRVSFAVSTLPDGAPLTAILVLPLRNARARVPMRRRVAPCPALDGPAPCAPPAGVGPAVVVVVGNGLPGAPGWMGVPPPLPVPPPPPPVVLPPPDPPPAAEPGAITRSCRVAGDVSPRSSVYARDTV